jgi:hypothetical protein
VPPCVKLARAIKITGISMFVRAAAGLRDTAALRLCRDAAAGVFLGGTGVAPVKFGVPPNFAGRRSMRVGGRWKNNRRRKRFPA